MVNRDFNKDLEFSDCIELVKRIKEFLKKYFEADAVEKNETDSDDLGIDYFVIRKETTLLIGAEVHYVILPLSL